MTAQRAIFTPGLATARWEASLASIRRGGSCGCNQYGSCRCWPGSVRDVSRGRSVPLTGRPGHARRDPPPSVEVGPLLLGGLDALDADGFLELVVLLGGVQLIKASGR